MIVYCVVALAFDLLNFTVQNWTAVLLVRVQLADR